MNRFFLAALVLAVFVFMFVPGAARAQSIKDCPKLPGVSFVSVKSKLTKKDTDGVGSAVLNCVYEFSNKEWVAVNYRWYKNATQRAKAEFCGRLPHGVHVDCALGGNSFCLLSPFRGADMSIFSHYHALPSDLVEEAKSYFTHAISLLGDEKPCSAAPVEEKKVWCPKEVLTDGKWFALLKNSHTSKKIQREAPWEFIKCAYRFLDVEDQGHYDMMLTHRWLVDDDQEAGESVCLGERDIQGYATHKGREKAMILEIEYNEKPDEYLRDRRLYSIATGDFFPHPKNALPCTPYLPKEPSLENCGDEYPIAVALGVFNDVTLTGCRGQIKARRMMELYTGDCVETGPDGRARVIFYDRDEARKTGPSVMNVAPNTKSCVDIMYTRSEDRVDNRPMVELIFGYLRAFLKGSGGQTDSFNIKAGVSLCGIRGSEGIVKYDPSTGTVDAYLNEGRMDVTVNGATRELTPGDMVTVKDGTAGPLQSFTPVQWDKMAESTKIPGEVEPSLEDNIALIRDLRAKAASGGDAAVGPDDKDSRARACKGGDGDACLGIAQAHENGDGVARDMTAAHDFYRTGCDAGNASSCNGIGVMYNRGNAVVKKNIAQALAYYKKGCDLGNGTSCGNYGDIYYSSEKDIVSGTREERDLEAGPYFEKGCARGHAKSCSLLGSMYYNGYGKAKDSGQALSFAQKGCDGGDATGCHNVGHYYSVEGDGIPVDRKLSAEAFEKGCDMNYDKSCARLGAVYRDGFGVGKDAAKARGFYQKACKLGHSKACEEAK